MNGINDNFEPGGASSGGAPRDAIRRTLARAANLCMGASFFALPMAVVQPNGGWLTGGVVGVGLYFVLSHFSREGE